MRNTNETINQKIAGAKRNKKTKIINDTTFGFTKNNLRYALKYRGNESFFRGTERRVINDLYCLILPFAAGF